MADNLGRGELKPSTLIRVYGIETIIILLISDVLSTPDYVCRGLLHTKVAPAIDYYIATLR